MAGRRWLAKRFGSSEWLHTDLPIDGEPLRELSGAGSFRTVVRPEMLTLIAEDGMPMFLSWSTELYLEEDDEIRWAGIVTWAGEDGASWTIEATGFGGYPHGQEFLGAISVFDTDPAAIVATIWAHLQSYQDGDLGVTVTGGTSSLVGAALVFQRARDPETGQFLPGFTEEWVKEPYELHWSDSRDCGDEIDSLSRDAPFDWVEEHRWADAEKTSVLHEIHIADRLGTRREDIRFEQGVNIVEPVPLDDEGELYVSDVRVIGAGEGEKAPVGKAAVRRPGRMRRARVLEAKAERSEDRLNRLARSALEYADGTLRTRQIVVRDHPYAPLGAWNLGDEVQVTGYSISKGRELTLWHRVTGWRLIDPSTAELSLMSMGGTA